jgi:hypothetical protein
MKKWIIFIAIVSLSFNIFAQEQTDTIPPVATTYSKQELTFLKDQYKYLIDINAKIIDDLKEERKNHQDFVENIYRWVTAIAIVVGIILSFFGWRTLKNAKKELLEKWNTSLKKLAIELKTNPTALREAIESKIVENELKNYGLIILHNNDEEAKANDMDSLLQSSGFKKIKRVSREKCTDKDLSKNNVIILFSDLDDDIGNKVKKSGCAVLGCGKREEISIDNIEKYANNKDCVTCCNSLATLYQNLLSLLYYMRITR